MATSEEIRKALEAKAEEMYDLIELVEENTVAEEGSSDWRRSGIVIRSIERALNALEAAARMAKRASFRDDEE